MIQALHAILGSDQEYKQPKMTMLYASRVSDYILGQEHLRTSGLKTIPINLPSSMCSVRSPPNLIGREHEDTLTRP